MCGESDLFGDEAATATLIDPLIRHCHIVDIRGNAYRVRDRRSAPQPGYLPQ